MTDAGASHHPDLEALLKVTRAVTDQGCYVFSLDPIDAAATAHARFFNPSIGIGEDPATGTAAGPLGCYLVARGVADGATMIVEQGYTMDRPSRIEVLVRGDHVRVSGPAVVVAEGTLRC